MATRPAATDHPDPPRTALDTAALLRPGAELICEMADFDAADFYRVRLESTADGVFFSYWFTDDPAEQDGDDQDGDDAEDGEAGGEGEAPEGEASVTAAALQRGDGVLFLSQGSVAAAEEPEAHQRGYQSHTPPFLVSHAVRDALRAGRGARLRVYGEDATVTRVDSVPQPLRVNGRDMQVMTIHATAPDLSVWVLDDPHWPLLVRAEFQGDNYIVLHSIQRGASAP